MIERALDALPEHFRSAVVLVDIEDQSYEAAAAVLHVPVCTERRARVEARLTRLTPDELTYRPEIVLAVARRPA
jgi:DNA-directed RNA polymerase specialized sigma24 family protein